VACGVAMLSALAVGMGGGFLRWHDASDMVFFLSLVKLFHSIPLAKFVQPLIGMQTG
jgi:hypothetical protein